MLRIVFFFVNSYDLREGDRGLQWRDNTTAGARARFHFYETGMRSETGAKVITGILVINPLMMDDEGVFRCRVDFREAPTRNTRIKLGMIGLTYI